LLTGLVERITMTVWYEEFDPEEVREWCILLQKELGIDNWDGNVGLTANGFFVMIYDKVKKPPLIKWMGRPVKYFIGGGMPAAS
jgi:hypothetical protein